MASKLHLYALLFSFFVLGIHAVTITVKNSCPDMIWPATLSKAGEPQASSTGFELAPQAERTIDVPAKWTSGRIWARTGCSSNNGGKLTCEIGECGNGIECNGLSGATPVSLAEFTLSGDGNKDTYDISVVDGFNLPIKVAPDNKDCKTISCPVDINNNGCPAEFVVQGGNGGKVACNSACAKYHEDKYCCTGAFQTPETCPPTDYSKVFKDKCPDAYSYAYNDQSSTFTCGSGANYLVEFCPGV